MPRVLMSQDRDVLQILRFELNYLEQGGFDRDRALLGTDSPFQGSFACINYGDPLQRHACHECLLHQFVPDNKKTEEFPCHHIVLSTSGETVEEFIDKQDLRRMVLALEHWLRIRIAALQATLDSRGGQ